MVSQTVSWLRRQTAGVVAVLLLISLYQLGKPPVASAEQVERLAARFAFTPYPIALPPGLPIQTIRKVNQDFSHLEGWVSSVGAGIAMNDLDGDGLANDLCLTDPRVDRAMVTPVPDGTGTARYAPFVLDPKPLPVEDTMAPMGCVPGDFNADGRMDLLVYYWGRTPIIYLARDDATELTAAAYRPVEMVDGVSERGRYTGPLWNTNAVAVADLDGDGYEDIVIGNFWPHGPVLDPTVSGDVAMPASLSYALNGGENAIYRWVGGTAGREPTVRYEEAVGALRDEWATGWALAVAAADLDGDLLPELYLAHDFGRDRLLYNRSIPGKIEFTLVEGVRAPLVPKSKVLGQGSFKGMGVDIADLDGDGRNDIFVSNITTSFGVQESNFAFFDTAADDIELGESLARGVAPYHDRSAPLGLAWAGWGWDVKLADLDNNGDREVVQTNGFVHGKVNRWPQLQEIATTNDDLVADPFWWPKVEAGDDLAGKQAMMFFVKGDDGRYVNLSHELGLAVPMPTRGIALGDATGNGRLDLAIARQWGEAVFYRNDSQSSGKSLSLWLTHDPGPAGPAGAEPATGEPGTLPPTGSPVVGARVTVTTPDGRTLIGHVDGGSGHSGKRSHEVFIGLGEVSGPVSVHLAWRDRSGEVREQELELAPGRHALRLGAQVQEEGS